MKSFIFWDIIWKSTDILEEHGAFQGWRISQSGNQHEADNKQSLLFNPDIAEDVFLRKAYVHQTIWYYILDIRSLHSHCCANLKPNTDYPLVC
jgi:hypothetical protein